MIAKLTLTRGDITKLKVDAVVNAANSSLLGGGGVDGAIHLAGGPSILEECKKIRERQGGCPTGEAVITSGANLPATYIIHTVGPIWQGGHQRENELLANAYNSSLRLAVENKVRRIAFPNISTGVYGFPKKEAAEIAISTIRKFIAKDQNIDEVIFCCFDEENYLLYKNLISE